jgi:hypothetical protein
LTIPYLSEIFWSSVLSVSVRIFPQLLISISIPSYHMSSAALAAAAKLLSLSFRGEKESSSAAVASAEFSELDAGRGFAPKHSTPAADSRQRQTPVVVRP